MLETQNLVLIIPLKKSKIIMTIKELVPSRKYEEIFPYIEETRKGKNNILWPKK